MLHLLFCKYYLQQNNHEEHKPRLTEERLHRATPLPQAGQGSNTIFQYSNILGYVSKHVL